MRSAADSLVALDDAQMQGAAPGAEAPVLRPASPCDRSAKRARWRIAAFALSVCAAAFAAWHAGDAAYLYAKAQLGQLLLQRAWDEARANGTDVKPWPWADTHPVARLRVPDRRVDVLVLAGANGRTLAWGPGHAQSSALPGAPGHAVVTGHRDTHFAFLRDLAPGDAIVVESASGVVARYRVERTFVADHRALRLPSGNAGTTLSLVTCWPFDGVDPGTPLRYAVVASAETPAATLARVAGEPKRGATW